MHVLEGPISWIISAIYILITVMLHATPLSIAYAAIKQAASAGADDASPVTMVLNGSSLSCTESPAPVLPAPPALQALDNIVAAIDAALVAAAAHVDTVVKLAAASDGGGDRGRVGGVVLRAVDVLACVAG